MPEEREGEADNPGPAGGDSRHDHEDEILISETTNYTSAVKNREALLRRKAVITAVQEHCLSPAQGPTSSCQAQM